jgi:hypothetical protein
MGKYNDGQITSSMSVGPSTPPKGTLRTRFMKALSHGSIIARHIPAVKHNCHGRTGDKRHWDGRNIEILGDLV